MPVQVLQWFSLIWLLNVPGPPPASDFDQSLEALERQRGITPLTPAWLYPSLCIVSCSDCTHGMI